MYLASDPRSALAPTGANKVPLPDRFAGADLGLFYETEPQETTQGCRTWYVRGHNMVISYSDTEPGAVLERADQPDEYALLIPQKETRISVTAGNETKEIDGFSVAFIPPGASRITVAQGGPLVRIFTPRATDLVAKCPNAGDHTAPRSNIPPLESWPVPPDGYKIRAYSLDVPREAGRFGRIWRCTTVMVNFIEPLQGPRDITKLSPHHHDDFEQCSLSLAGSYIHHLRWPWTPDMNAWREDEHLHVKSPSVTIIPPPAIHTSRGMDAGLNQLVDIFVPPRRDFSDKPGWVLNASDYPMP